MTETRHTVEVNALLDALRARHEPENNSIVPKNFVHTLVLGVIGAAGALVWTTTTKSPESLGVLSQQTTEIRTTVLEMRGTLTGINERLERNARDTSDIQTKVSALEANTRTAEERIKRLEEDSRERRR